MEDTHHTIDGAKASCTDLYRYCSHAKGGSAVKQVCPATCGVCSGGCADGCGWTKKWPCPEDATESANDVCFNLCCMSFKPPMSWNRPSGFREVYSIIAICTSFVSFVVFPQEPIRPTGLPIVILSIIFFFLLYALLFVLTIVDYFRATRVIPHVVALCVSLFFAYSDYYSALLERWASSISGIIGWIINLFVCFFFWFVLTLLPAAIMTTAMILKYDTSEEELGIAYWLCYIAVLVIWITATWAFKGGVDAKPRKCFGDALAWLFRDKAPYIKMPVPGPTVRGTTRPAHDRARAEEKARASMDEDGFALILLDPNDRKDKRPLETLQALLDNTDARDLGQGKDIRKKYGAYDRLQLACAWKIDNQKLSDKYEAGKESVQKDMDLLQRRGVDVTKVPGLPVKTAQVSGSFSFTQGVNEVMLLHGTNPSVLEEILANGLNPRLSGSNAGVVFGEGIYLAEDVGKTDHYVMADSEYGDDINYNPESTLHERLYGSRSSCGPQLHPGDVFYVLAVRVVLGYPVRTQEAGPSAREMKGFGIFSQRERVFPTTFKELNYIPDVRPKMHYHSLIAETGVNILRYREFVVFRDYYVLPEYLIAYQRFDGDRKLTTC